MRDIKKKGSRQRKPAAKSAKVSNRQNMYIIAGILAVIVISGIMLSQTSFLTVAPSGQAPAAQAEQEQTGTAVEELSPAASISLTNSPASAYTNTPVSFIWKIGSGEKAVISHTAIHYDTRSVPSPAAYTDYRKAGRFFDGEAPDSFSDSMTILEAGTYYYRAHAVVDGKEIWSDEKTLVVSKRFG